MQPTTYQAGSRWEFAEHVRALRAVDRITIRHRPVVRIFRIVFPFAVVALLAGSVLGAVGIQPPLVIALSLLPYLLIVALWFALIFWGQFYLAARRTRQLDPSTQGILMRTFTADGFRIDGAGQAVDLRWEGIHSAVETPEFFLIFLNRLCAYYVPKHLISRAQERNDIRQLLRAKLAERAVLQKEGTV